MYSAASAPSAAQAKLAAGMPRKQLVSFGTAFGKFTKSKQFRLHVTCLDFVAQHAQHDSTFNRRPSQPCPHWPPVPPQVAPGGSGSGCAWRLRPARQPQRWNAALWAPQPSGCPATASCAGTDSPPSKPRIPPRAPARAQALGSQPASYRHTPVREHTVHPHDKAYSHADHPPTLTLTLTLTLTRHKVWLKPSAEQSFLYGNHVLKVGYTFYSLLLMTHYSLVAVYCSLLTAHGSRLTAHGSLHTAHCLRLATCFRRAWVASPRTRRSTRASSSLTWPTCHWASARPPSRLPTAASSTRRAWSPSTRPI